MFYQRLADLPKGVRDNLPKHGQEIYRVVFNNAWEEYDHDKERRSSLATINMSASWSRYSPVTKPAA